MTFEEDLKAARQQKAAEGLQRILVLREFEPSVENNTPISGELRPSECLRWPPHSPETCTCYNLLGS